MRNTLSFAAGFFTAALFAVILFTERPKISTVIKEVTPVIENWGSRFDPIVDAGVRFPEVVMSQLILETGYGQSEVFKQNGNAFGMKHNKRGFSKGSKLGHADYGGDFNKSLADYMAWQKKYLSGYETKQGKKVKTNEEYIQFLKDYGYAEDKNYPSKLKDILEYVKKVHELKQASS